MMAHPNLVFGEFQWAFHPLAPLPTSPFPFPFPLPLFLGSMMGGVHLAWAQAISCFNMTKHEKERWVKPPSTISYYHPKTCGSYSGGHPYERALEWPAPFEMSRCTGHRPWAPTMQEMERQSKESPLFLLK